MAQNILRSSTRACTRANTACRVRSAKYSSNAASWFRRFLSPSEEKELYLGITSSFREKLVEQSNKSTQNYSHIIEHALLTGKPTNPNKITKTGMLSIARMEQLKIDLDAAGKQKDLARLQKLELEMDHANLTTVAMYNRLIRSYLWSDSIELAEQVLNGFKERELVPTTRSFTYLIQAYLKKDQVEEAKSLVIKMQEFSLHHKLRNEFDCNIMMKYYMASGDSYALDFLWRDVMLHIDTIKPGNGLFTLYLEHLLEKSELKSVSQLTQEFVLNQQSQQHLTHHQYMTWIKAVNLLTETHQQQKLDTQKAEQLLLVLIKKAPAKLSWDIAKSSIEKIVTSYLKKEQDLKALAFYYRLQKIGVPYQAY